MKTKKKEYFKAVNLRCLNDFTIRNREKKIVQKNKIEL